MRNALSSLVVCTALVALAACGGGGSDDAEAVRNEALEGAHARVEQSHAAYQEASAELHSLIDAHLADPSEDSGVAVIDQTRETVTASRSFLDNAREYRGLADQSGYLDGSSDEESRSGDATGLLRVALRLQTSAADAEALEQHIEQLQEQIDALTSTGSTSPQDLLEINELDEQLSEATIQLNAILKSSYDLYNSTTRNVDTQ